MGMTLLEWVNVIFAFDLVVGGVVGLLWLFHGYDRYFAYCRRYRRGEPLGDPTDGKLGFVWLLFVICIVPVFNLFGIYVVLSVFFSWLFKKVKA